MNRQGKILLTVRLIGAGIACAGFLILAVRPDYGVLSSVLVGIGSIVIAAGSN